MKLKNKLIVASLIGTSTLTIAQQQPTGFGVNGVGANANTFWARGGNLPNTPPGNNIFGTMWNSPVYHFTNGTLKHTTTVNNGLSTLQGVFPGGAVTGDGISIAPGVGSAPAGSLDLFTSGQNQTFIRMDGSALLATTNNQFQQYANLNGFWFNATGNGGTPQYIFNIANNERGRLGANGFWRYGSNTTNLTANNIIEIVSQANNPYGITGSGLRLANLRSTNAAILPTIVNGIDNTKVLSVDANGDVVLVNAQAGNTTTGNNGISINNTGLAQLGVPCTAPAIDKVNNRLTSNRFLHLGGNNLIFGDGGRVGIGMPVNGAAACAVGNKLELTSGNLMPYWNVNAVNGSSGLRLTHLTSAKTPVTNGTNGVNNTKVLSVDANGDVVLVTANATASANNGTSVSGGNVQFGQAIGAVGNPGQLLNDRELPQNINNIYYTGQTEYGKSAIYMGFPNTTINQGKLNVLLENNNHFNNSTSGIYSVNRNYYANVSFANVSGVTGVSDVLHTVLSRAKNFGGYFIAEQTYPTGVIGIARNSVGTFAGVGVRGESITNSQYNKGGAFTASPADYNTTNTSINDGVYGIGSYGVTARGVVGQSLSGGTNNYGGYFSASSAPNAFGIFADAAASQGAISTNWAGYFNGNTFTSAAYLPSDKNLKKEFKGIDKALDRIMKLTPSYYLYDQSKAQQYGMNLPTGYSYGFIAQNVKEQFPELVIETKNAPIIDTAGVVTNDTTLKFMAVNYNGMIGVLAAGMQEMNAKLDKSGLSDAQVKTNVSNFNALAKIKTLNPVSYNYTNQNVPQLALKNNLEYGFVAQQLQTVYPELIDTINIAATYDSLGNVQHVAKTLKTVNYKAINALLTRAVQEQQVIIDSLRLAKTQQDSINQAVQQQLASLLADMRACCANTVIRKTNTAANQLEVELSDKNAVVLNQNVPNPFAEQTTISYNVPVSVAKAQLLFYSNEGKLIQTLDIATRGKGTVNVFANDLSSGLYHYTLVVDGKVADSKKMIKE